MVAEDRITAHGPEGAAPALPTPPALSSHGRSWQGVIFERHLVEPGALPQHTLAEHCFLLPMGHAAVPYQCTIDGRRVAGHMVPDKIQFRAAGTTVTTSWTAPLDGVFVALSHDALVRNLDEESRQRPFELVSDLSPQDNPVLLHLTRALDAHLRSGALRGRLFEQSLLGAICASLLLSYGTLVPARPRRYAMSPRTLRKVHEFIEANLAREFSIDDIAQAACLSPYHLGRAYRQTTGQSLWQYVLQCRAALARSLIAARPGATLAEIAGLSGFESYSQFIAVFRKAHGMTPGEYRRMLH